MITSFSKQTIVEAPPDGQGGPRWVAILEDGTRVVGRPTWLTSGRTVALPADGELKTDWQRLMDRCAENKTRLNGLSLFVPPWGWFHAPTGKGCYGYFEVAVIAMKQKRGGGTKGVESLTIVWEEKEEGAVRGYRVQASGVLEGVRYPQRLPCMVAV